MIPRWGGGPYALPEAAGRICQTERGSFSLNFRKIRTVRYPMTSPSASPSPAPKKSKGASRLQNPALLKARTAKAISSLAAILEITEVELAVRLGWPHDRIKKLSSDGILRDAGAFRCCLATGADPAKLLTGVVDFGEMKVLAELPRPLERRSDIRAALAADVTGLFLGLAKKMSDRHVAVLFADVVTAMAAFHAAVYARKTGRPRDVTPTQTWTRLTLGARTPGWAIALKTALRAPKFAPNRIREELAREFLADFPSHAPQSPREE